jgi:hypothetical protein
VRSRLLSVPEEELDDVAKSELELSQSAPMRDASQYRVPVPIDRRARSTAPARRTSSTPQCRRFPTTPLLPSAGSVQPLPYSAVAMPLSRPLASPRGCAASAPHHTSP